MSQQPANHAAAIEAVLARLNAHSPLSAEEIATLRAEFALFTPELSIEGFEAQALMRANAILRAASRPRPRAKWRADHGLADVTLHDTRIPYKSYFATQELDISHRQFDGGQSATMKRAGFLMADAVTVLPYDPVRDRVLVIEQMRVGPLLRQDPRPWLLEPIAGRIDGGDAPEDTAKREALEEAGITLSALHLIGEMYPSPGAITEFLYSYIGIADLPDDITGIGGLDSEHEDIASMLLSFDELMDLCDAGQLDTSPLFLSALWLDRHRKRLR